MKAKVQNTGMVLAALLCLSSGAHAQSSLVVKGEDLRTLLSGNSLDGRTERSVTYQAFHTTDGKISARSSNGQYTSGGVWRIDEAGNICVTWTNRDWKNDCWSVAQEGSQYRFSSISDAASYFLGAQVPGNPFNF